MNLILLGCVRYLLLLLRLVLMPPTAMSTLLASGANGWNTMSVLVIAGIGVDGCPVPSGIAPLAAASTTDDWTPVDRGERGIIILTLTRRWATLAGLLSPPLQEVGHD